ncbi:MAG TPA: DcaP family trimeric outer membrane transporter [Candidatus Angelobacter sp.]
MNAFRVSRVFLSLLPLIAFPSWTYAQTTANQTNAQALQQQVDTLKTQIADLEDKIKNLTPSGPANPDSSGTPQAKGTDVQQGAKPSDAAEELKTKQTEIKATANYKRFSEDEIAVARYDNVPLDPHYPNYFRLPGTKTFMRIGGYAKSDITFDPRPAGDQERFIPASIPIPASLANVSNSTLSVRPSRINVDFLVPIEKERALRFFFEMDFFGSSSTTPRLRHVYAQGKNLLIGQTFSNFMDVDAGPDTLDFQGPNSWVSIRNPQVRYTHRFSKATTASISVEKASSDVAFKTPEFNAQPNSPSPDGTVQLRHEMKLGHIQFAGLFRDISAFLPDGRSDSVFGWGFNLAGLFKIGKDAFVYQGAYGNGIERYINDTSGLGIDAAVVSKQDPHLEAVPAIATYGGYQHFWAPKVRSSAVFGFLQAENTAAQVSSAFHRSEYSAVNLIWSPIASLSFGSEFLYGWRVNRDNSTGNAPRIQLSAKYNFMQMKSSK